MFRTRSVSAAARAAFTASAERRARARRADPWPGSRRGENRNREQNEKRQEFVRLGDREGVQRLNEDEAEEREC